MTKLEQPTSKRMAASVKAPCQSCDGECVEVINLGRQPICNLFLASKQAFAEEKLYPLDLVYCPKCTLVQLRSVPPREVVFGKDFGYLTGSYPEAVHHFKNLAERLAKTFKLRKGDYVVDIGSNDGTFLKNFAARGVNVLGIEPTPKPAHLAEETGVTTFVKPFEDAIPEIKKHVGSRLRLVTALNVLAHTDNVHGFLDGVAELSRIGEVDFISQSHYLPDMIDKTEWDMVYHEHARYYTVRSLGRLLKGHKFVLRDAERTNYLGGSFIAYASLRKAPRTQRLQRMVAAERRFSSYKPYRDFAKRVVNNSSELHMILADIKDKGGRVAGVGAPMKSSTLLNYSRIDSGLVDYLTEVNKLKVGLYSPGTHIPVRDEKAFFDNPPDYALILAWNVASRIMAGLRERGYTGKFIVPIPEPRVVN